MTILAVLILVNLALAARSWTAGSRLTPARVAWLLDRGLAGTPMRGLGGLLEREGRRWNVNPALVAGIAGTESGFGAARCQGFNAWGWGSCGRAWPSPYLSSWRQAVAYTTRRLRVRWLDQEAGSVEAIGRSYCPGCGSWPAVTRRHMARFGLGSSVEYPQGR